MVKSDQMARHEKERESAAVFPAVDAAAQKRAAINIDDEGDQNKKQKLSDSVVTTTTDIFTRYSRVQNHYNVALCSISKSLSLLTNVDIDDEGHEIQKRVAASKKEAAPKKRAAKKRAAKTAAKAAPKAAPNCSDGISILSTEEEAMMKQIRGIAHGGYFEGLKALIVGRSIPTTAAAPTAAGATAVRVIPEILYNNEEPAQPQRIRSVTPPPGTTHKNLHNKSRNNNSSKLAALLLHHEEDEDENSILKPATLAILKQEMSDIRYIYSKKKPKEGRWAHSTAAENIDSWVKDTSGGIVLSVHQLMIFLQAYSYDQLDMRKSFLQKCNLQQFFVDIAPEKIQSDLNTIKKCLKLIQIAASDTTKIAKQITILENVSIVQSMIKVKKERAKSQWKVDSILTTAAAPIQELMKHPEVEVARKFVEVDLLMTCSIGDTQSKSLEDIKSLCVASFPVPGKNHKQVYDNLGWMKMECNKTMWILLNAAVCVERLTSALPIGSTKNYLGCTLFVEMLPMVLDPHFAKTDKKKGGYPFMFQFLCKAFDMNVGEEYWKVINESLPNLNCNCIQLLGKHLLSSPFFPYQAGDKVLWNKHPETSFYTVKEDDCNIEMIHQQCLHVAHTLDLPYHRPTDIELLAIAQVVGMVPAADNSFKFQTTSKGGRKGGRKGGKAGVAMKVGAFDPKHRGKGSRARGVLKGHQQWNDKQIQVLLEYVIANCGSGTQIQFINWSKWDTDGVEGCNKDAGKSKLQSLKKEFMRMNEGDDRKTNDANIKQFYQIVLAEQFAV